MRFCSRYLLVLTATYHMLGLRSESDVFYNPIPLYHMSGGIVGIGCALAKGIPSVLRNKFSVTAYWTDCIKYNCTVSKARYIYLTIDLYYKNGKNQTLFSWDNT